MAFLKKKNDTANLEKVRQRALRFVFNEKQTPCYKLLTRIGLQSLENRCVAKIVFTDFNVINNVMLH